MTIDEIAGLMDAMGIGERREIDGINVHKRQDSFLITYWVQSGGGVTYHKSSRRAAQALIRLRNYEIREGLRY